MFRKKQAKKVENVETIIGPGTKIEGKITISSSLRVDGKVDGEINSTGNVFVGKNGSIGPKVEAENVTISGQATGDIHVKDKLHIQASGKVSGNVISKGIVIEEGGIFNGQSKIDIPEINNHESKEEAE